MIFAILIAAIAAVGVAAVKKNQTVQQPTTVIMPGPVQGRLSRPDFHPTSNDVRIESSPVTEGAPTVYNPGDPGKKTAAAGAPAPAGIPPGAPGGSPSGSGGYGTGATGGHGIRNVL